MIIWVVNKQWKCCSHRKKNEDFEIYQNSNYKIINKFNDYIINSNYNVPPYLS
jgi:hypothetical protein